MSDSEEYEQPEAQKETNDKNASFNAKKAHQLAAESEEEEEEVVPDGQYVVEKILDVRFKPVKGRKTNRKQYLIKWEGYDADDNTWEDEDNLHCTTMLEEFETARGKKESKPSKKTPQNPKVSKRVQKPSSVTKFGGRRSARLEVDAGEAQAEDREDSESEQHASPEPPKVASATKKLPRPSVSDKAAASKGARPKRSSSALKGTKNDEVNAKTALGGCRPTMSHAVGLAKRTDKCVTGEPSAEDVLQEFVVTLGGKTLAPSAPRDQSGSGSVPPSQENGRKKNGKPAAKNTTARKRREEAAVEPNDEPYNKSMTVLVMKNGEVFQQKTIKYAPDDVVGTTLEYDWSRVLDEKERIHVLGQVQMIKPSGTFFIVIPEAAPSVYIGYEEKFMREHYPKTMKILEKLKAFTQFLDDDIEDEEATDIDVSIKKRKNKEEDEDMEIAG